MLIAHVGGCEGPLTVLGCVLYLAARVLYVPLYAFGVPVVRTLTWLVSIVGLVMIVKAILFG